MREKPYVPKFGPRKVRTAVKLAGSIYGAVRGAVKGIKNMKVRGEDRLAGYVGKAKMAAQSAGRVLKGDFREVGGAARDTAARVIKASRRARDRNTRAQQAVNWNNDLAKIEAKYGPGAAEYSKLKFSRHPYAKPDSRYGSAPYMNEKKKTLNDFINQDMKKIFRNPGQYMNEYKSGGAWTPRIDRAAEKSQSLGAKITLGGAGAAGYAAGYHAQKKAARGGK